jgi:hypothetical protein
MYHKGLGVTQKAFKWYRKAAEQGQAVMSDPQETIRLFRFRVLTTTRQKRRNSVPTLARLHQKINLRGINLPAGLA